MAEKNKIIVLDPCTKSVEDLLGSIEAKGQVEVLRVQSPEEADQLVKQNQPCMLVLCVQDNSEVPPRVNMLKKLESVIKKGLLKSFVTSKLKNRQLGTLITSLGVTDFIEEPAPVRTMQFKANLQLKAVETIRKQEEMKKASQEKIVFKKSEAKKGEDAATGQEAAAKSKPALQLQEDAFLFKNSGAKKLGKKMVVELEGPDPSTGEWVQHEDKGNAQTSWRWVPKDEKEAAAQGAGNGWVHEGEKPEFKEQSGKWQFTSEKPDLSFRKNGEKIASKLATDENGELVVAEDSPAALANVEKNKALAKRIREKKAAAFGDASDPAEVEAAAEAARALKGTANNAAAEAARKLGSLPEASTEEAASFNNHTGGKKDGPEGAFSDQSGAGGQEPGGAGSQKMGTKGEEEPAAPLSPLEFLKKKKQAKAKQPKDLGELPEPAEEAAAGELAAAAKAEAESGSEEASEIERAARAPKKKKKSASDAAQEMLARMKSKLGDGPATDEPTEAPAAAPDEPAPEAAAEEADPLETRRKGKGKEKAEPPAAEAAPEEGEDPVARERMERRKKERKDKKRDLLKEVQDIMAEPLPESLPFEEAAALREKLGLGDQPELSDRDLARKDRLEKVKKIKERLLEIDQLPLADEAPPTTNEHNLKAEDPENTWSESDSSGGGAPERKLRAFDSEDSSAAEEDEETLRKRRREEARGERAPTEDRYVYVPAAEIQPAGNAWEKAGEEYYVYLDSQVRYRGFDKIEDTLPLWIFRGEQVPELLDKTQQWRFLDRPPVKAATTAELPRDVKDFLLELRDRVKKEKSERPEESSEAARGEAPADQAEGLKEKFEKKKRNEAQDRLDRLKDQLSDDPLAERGPSTEAEGGVQEGEEELSEAAKEEKLRRQEAAEGASKTEAETREEEIARQEIEGKRARAEENSGEASTDGEEKSEKKNDAFQSRLDALRSRVDQGEDALSEDKAKAAEERAATQEGAPPETLEKTLPTDPGPLSMADVSAKPSVKAFLERRKSKSKETKERPPVAPARDPYLGIYVAVSNALGHVGDQRKSLLRVLSSIEGSFERCAAAVLEPPESDGRCAVRTAHPDHFSNSRPVDLSTGLAFPIQREDGAGEQILGYLFLKPLADREEFAEDEQRAAQKVARSLWAVLSAAAARPDGERRAA